MALVTCLSSLALAQSGKSEKKVAGGFEKLNLQQLMFPEAKQSSAILAKGKELFMDNCVVCHGPSGGGDGPAAQAMPIKPRNYKKEKFKYGSSLVDIVNTIYVGRSELMPSFANAFKPKEVWALAHFVLSWVPSANRDPNDRQKMQSWKPPQQK